MLKAVIPKLQHFFLLLTVLATPLLVNFWVEQQFEASKVWLLRTMIWVLAVLWLGGWMAGATISKLPSHILKLSLLLSIVLIISTLLSSNHYIAMFGSLDRAGGVITQLSYLILFIGVAAHTTSRRSRVLLHILIWTAVPICIAGLAQAMGWQPLPVITDARSTIVTTLGRANFTGAYLVLLLPLTINAALSTNSRVKRNFYWILTLLEVLIICLSQARAAWISAAVSILILFCLRALPRPLPISPLQRRSGFIVILGGAFLLFFQISSATSGSIAARWSIWQASLGLLWARIWFGYGADTLELFFPSVYPPELVYYQGRGIAVDRAHNWLLDWSLNYGVMATAIFIALISIILRLGWQHLINVSDINVQKSDNQNLEKGWIAACIAGICAHLTCNLFLFDVASTAMVFWLLLAIVASASIKGDLYCIQKSLSPWKIHLFLLISIIFLSWATWHSNVRPLLADMRIWRGNHALSKRNTSAALEEYKAAAIQQPRRVEYHVAFSLTAAASGDFAQAEREMHKAITLQPADPVLHTHLAAIYAGQAINNTSKKNLAYEAYRKAISLGPTIAQTYQQYADLALRSGDWQISLPLARQAVNLDETDGRSFGILGWSQLHNSNPGAAEVALTEAVKWIPDSADYHLGLATALFHQGKIIDARQSLQRSLSLNPTSVPALTLQMQLSK